MTALHERALTELVSHPNGLTVAQLSLSTSSAAGSVRKALANLQRCGKADVVGVAGRNSHVWSTADRGADVALRRIKSQPNRIRALRAENDLLRCGCPLCPKVLANRGGVIRHLKTTHKAVVADG